MPFFFITLRTSMTPVQAAAAVDGVSREKRSLSEFFETMGQPDANQFIGKVDSAGFKLTRVIGYQNSFLPVITGRFVATPAGTEVRVTMRLVVWVYAFIAFVVLSGLPSPGAASAKSFWLPGVFVVLLTLAGFIPEVIAARGRLRKVLDG